MFWKSSDTIETKAQKNNDDWQEYHKSRIPNAVKPVDEEVTLRNSGAYGKEERYPSANINRPGDLFRSSAEIYKNNLEKKAA